MSNAHRARQARWRSLAGACCALAAGVLAGGQTAPPRAPPPTRPASRPGRPLPLALARPLPLRDYSLKELAARWPAFGHAPFATAGHNHLSLPFRWASEGEVGEPAEANAFAFLLGNDLDWSPGNYCARHAYFVFKRARRYMAKMVEGYDPDVVRFAVRDWAATHGVGGLLKRTRLGYTGALEIFDAAGKLTHSKHFARPREYFDLLGEMSCHAIRHFGHEPNEALVKHLHRKRCKHHQSIVDLGRAAFAEQRGQEEFDLYRQILRRDPGFADVRYWYGNQKWWRDGDTAEYNRQKALACKSYLVLSALTDFRPDKCPDKELAAAHGGWMAQADRMTGGEHVELLERLLAHGPKSARSPALVRRATAAARRNPNSHWLLYHLAEAYDEVYLDADLAASLAVAAVRDRYLVGRGGKYDATSDLARYLYNLGYYDQVAALLRPLMESEARRRDLPKAAWCAHLLGDALRNMGRCAEAVPVYRRSFHYHRPGEPERPWILVKAAVCAAQAGRQDWLRQVLDGRRKQIDRIGMGFLVDAYARLLRRQPVTVREVAGRAPAGWKAYKEHLQLTCQLDLMAGRQDQRKKLARFMARDTNWRTHWILYDAYDRAAPKGESIMFYEALTWLFPDDPWVAQAATEARARIADPVRLGAEELGRRLRDYAPDDWVAPAPARDRRAEAVFRKLPYGAVESAVHRLLTAGQRRQALDLASRYRRLAAEVREYHSMRRANRLIHLVGQATPAGQTRPATATAPGGRPPG